MIRSSKCTLFAHRMPCQKITRSLSLLMGIFRILDSYNCHTDKPWNSQARKKVHIVPVGFEIDRIELPLRDIGADRVYLWQMRKK